MSLKKLSPKQKNFLIFAQGFFAYKCVITNQQLYGVINMKHPDEVRNKLRKKLAQYNYWKAPIRFNKEKVNSIMNDVVTIVNQIQTTSN